MLAKLTTVLTNEACDAAYGGGLINNGHICIDSKGGHGVCNVSYNLFY
jgi:hypothetical protein